MRDIKFKIWDKKTNEMFDVLEIGLAIGYVVFGDSDERGLDEVELMQFTGIKDENETEVYEGDVLRLEGYSDMFVDFVDGDFVAKSTNDVQRANWQPLRLVAMINKGYEVIGNIYENNKLINAQSDQTVDTNYELRR